MAGEARERHGRRDEGACPEAGAGAAEGRAKWLWAGTRHAGHHAERRRPEGDTSGARRAGGTSDGRRERREVVWIERPRDPWVA
jgi:hypothetical protein